MCFLLLAWLAPSSLVAQAVLNGRVVADSSERPLALAEIIVEELGLVARTVENGRFRLGPIPLGRYTLRVRRIGFQSAVAGLRVEGADSVEVEFSMVAIVPELEPLLVEAKARPSRWTEIAERHRSGHSTVVSFTELRQLEYLRLPELLRRYRIPVPDRPAPIIKSAALPNGCPRIFLDGALISDLTQIPLAWLGAVEIYRRPLWAPIQYQMGASRCPIILLWTRDT
ncbi:MAG: carboxypeptidase-like regulatory domain-containing protein [Gemmatimonadales bacterium]